MGLPRNLNVPYLAMAIWAGWRYYKVFARECPKDFEQEVVVAALLCSSARSDNEAFRTITRRISKALRSYGYATAPDGSWTRREKLRAGSGSAVQCGIEECGSAGAYRDARYKRLCARHAAYVRLRRKRGDTDPYQGLETLDRRGPRSKLVRCLLCGSATRKSLKRISERPRHFCSPDCYHKWRRDKSMAEIKAA